MEILIKNLRGIAKPSQPWQVKICRPNPLGNPFELKYEVDRDKVCNEYHTWFWDCYYDVGNDVFHREVHRLHGILHKYHKLELWCWCSPKRCHAETIKECLENT